LEAPVRGENVGMGETARRSFVATSVAVLVVAAALALWHLKVLVALLLLSVIVAAAMRPGVEWLHRHGIARGLGVALHYLGFVVAVGLLLWLIVPNAITQVQHAIGSTDRIHHAAKHSTGIKHDLLTAVDQRLRRLPAGSSLVHGAVTITRTALEVIIGTFFIFATAAYWVFERDRALQLILGLVSPRRRRIVRDTWLLIDVKLGAFVRGQLVMIIFVSTMLSLAFWLDGLPYWLLIGVFAGIVEIVPVVGPLAAAVTAIGVGLTVDWKVAAGAAVAVWSLRLLQDYVVGPRVLGHAVGLSPLIVLVTVTAVGLLLGGFYVLLSVPIAAVLATLVDVAVLDKDPAKEEVPPVLFPAKDVEAH
jgi:predicted PurR-regulated permease PerM